MGTDQPCSDLFALSQVDDIPTTLGLSIIMEYRPKLGPEPERWSVAQRQQYCCELTQVIEDYPGFKKNSWRPDDKSAKVVPQFNWSDEEPRLPVSVIIWLNGWYDDPTPEDQFNRSYDPPDPFAWRRYLEEHGYHISTIEFGYDPVMAG